MAALAYFHFVELDLTLRIDAVPDGVLPGSIVGSRLIRLRPLFHHCQFWLTHFALIYMDVFAEKMNQSIIIKFKIYDFLLWYD